jgi:hypothetical protein
MLTQNLTLCKKDEQIGSRQQRTVIYKWKKDLRLFYSTVKVHQEDMDMRQNFSPVLLFDGIKPIH